MPNLTKETGSTGLKIFSGIITDDFMRELTGSEKYKRYNEMRLNSPVIGAMLKAIEYPILAMDWYCESTEGEDDPRLEFIKSALDGMSHSWRDHLTEALSFLWCGFAPFEIVYKREAGRYMWRKFAIRGQDTITRWKFDDEGGLEGFYQVAPPKYQEVYIPIEKAVLYRVNVERNNPEGRSILRQAWIPYYYAKHFQQLEGIGGERDVAGLPVITMPEGADTDPNSETSDAGVANKIVRNVRVDEQAGIVLPNGWDFKLVSSAGGKAFDLDKIIRRYESRMLMAALAQFLLLGQDNVGSLALSKDQTDFFNNAVNSSADIIAETFSKFAIPRLLALNGLPEEGITMTHTRAEGDANMQTVFDMLSRAGDKITWTDMDEAWLRLKTGMPELDTDGMEREDEPDMDDGEEMDDDYTVETYQAKPDAPYVRKLEKRYARGMSAALKKIRARVMASARRLRK